ncbi:hypothetical protein, partial [Amycolatopsis lexingtonensis]|uniref:hypothetical protein n=1 Tax=Amycolatopsis lexingtonensis TaxID=218822 RepID=UPI001B805178
MRRSLCVRGTSAVRAANFSRRIVIGRRPAHMGAGAPHSRAVRPPRSASRAGVAAAREADR